MIDSTRKVSLGAWLWGSSDLPLYAAARLGIGRLNDWSTKCQVQISCYLLVQCQLIGSHSVLAWCAQVWTVRAAHKTPLHGAVAQPLCVCALRVMKSSALQQLKR